MWWLELFQVCLFVWSLPSHWRIFHSYEEVTIAGEGLQILTYPRHSWPLSSEGPLICHTHCDTGLPFIMVISEDQWHSHLLLSIWQWSCHYLFLRLRSVATGDQTPIPRTRGERSTSMPPRWWLFQVACSQRQLNVLILWVGHTRQSRHVPACALIKYKLS